MANTTNRIVLVTGGSKGLGRDTALALAKDGVGVVVTHLDDEEWARDVVGEIKGMERRAATLRLDASAVVQSSISIGNRD